MKAVIYARVSTHEQALEEKVSLDLQIEEIKNYCQVKGYEIIQPYYLDIQSGTDSLKNRPQFEKMLDDAKRGAFDVIVAWRPDRLFRNMWPAARLKRIMNETEVKVETVTQPIDENLLGLWAWLAEMEIQNFVERSRMGKQGAALKGKVVTKCAPYGYYVDSNGYPQINENEAYIITRIFRDYVREDKPVETIAAELNSEGVPTRKGREQGWSPPYIHRILRNRVYIGYGTWGQYRHLNGKRAKKQPEENWIKVPFPPIVTKELFQQAQEKKATTKSKIEHHGKVFYPLANLMYCRECGYKFLPRTYWKWRARRNYGKGIYEYRYNPPKRYYKCYGMFRYSSQYQCRKPGHILADEIENLIWSKVVELVKNPAFVEEGIKSCQEELCNSEIVKELERAERQLAEIDLKKERATKIYVDGTITEQDLKIQMKFINDQKEFFEREVNRLSKQVEELKARKVSLENLYQLSEQIKERLENMDESERAELIQLLVQRVWLDGEGNIDIELGIPEKLLATPNADMYQQYDVSRILFVMKEKLESTS